MNEHDRVNVFLSILVFHSNYRVSYEEKLPALAPLWTVR